MTYEEAKMQIKAIPGKIWDQLSEPDREAMEMAFSALEKQEETVSRKVYEQISWERDIAVMQLKDLGYGLGEKIRTDGGTISRRAATEPDKSKYEYHYDHTDCIWYRPEARNRCPSTCAQYRDGWNDAMQYIFRDGKGYRPYRRDEPYER